MKNQVKLISYLTLRQLIGWLGIILPLVLIAESTVYCHTPIRNSISHYYYSNLGDVFVAILTALSVFLFFYKGYEKEKDNLLTNITALAALGVAFFPTDGVIASCMGDCEGKIPSSLYHLLHLIAASIFFLSLAILLLFFFTRTEKATEPTPQKKSRNIVYRTCGSIMLLCFLWVVLNMIQKNDNIFWQESIALVAFGIAWLIKGELFLKDETH